MKLSLLFLFPLLLASCSDLTPKDQEKPVDAPPPPPEYAKKTPKPAPAPKPSPAPEPVVTPVSVESENPLDFLDPDTTSELMTDEKKKTVSKANAAAPPPEVEADNAIDIDPPTLPEIKE